MEPVGVIGLGLMGSALAERFRAAGFASSDSISREGARDRLAGHRRRAGRVGPRRVFAGARRGAQPAEQRGRGGGDSGGRRIARRRDHHRHDDRRPGRDGERRSRTRGTRGDYLDATLTGSSAEARAGEVVVTAGGRAEVFAACRAAVPPVRAAMVPRRTVGERGTREARDQPRPRAEPGGTGRGACVRRAAADSTRRRCWRSSARARPTRA